MKSIKFARWEIECDEALTRELFTQVQSGAPEACGCTPCLNFAAARLKLYPSEVIRVFDSLGIPHNREAEVYHTHRIGPGRHRYGGWFHFVGKLHGGRDACKQIGATRDGPVWGVDLEKVGADFEMGFTQRIGLLEKPFQDHPVLQLEFQATVPWLLVETEPEI